MRLRSFIMGVGILLSAAVSACGGGDEGASQEDQVRTTIENARQAAVDGDAKAFCGYLSPQVIADLKENDDINSVVPTCEALVDANSTSVSEVAKPAVTISDVSVDGTTATVTAQLEGQGERRFVTLGQPITVDLVQLNGEWKLASLPDQ